MTNRKKSLLVFFISLAILITGYGLLITMGLVSHASKDSSYEYGYIENINESLLLAENILMCSFYIFFALVPIAYLISIYLIVFKKNIMLFREYNKSIALSCIITFCFAIVFSCNLMLFGPFEMRWIFLGYVMYIFIVLLPSFGVMLIEGIVIYLTKIHNKV